MKPETPLQRGKACLCCRKRKMKCDGVRPVCTQCIKASRGNECKYHDKKQISRTQLLQQKVAKLEARLRELESEQSDMTTESSPAPSYSGSIASTSALPSPSLTLMQPDAVSSSTAPSDWSSQMFDETVFPELGNSFSPFYPSQASSSVPSHSPDLIDPTSMFLQSSYSSVPMFPSQTPQQSDPSNTVNNTKWWEDTNTFCQQKQMLLDMFLAHRHQFAFDIHIERFQTSMTYAAADKPHPALMDSIYLMACHLSQSPPLTELEPHFLKRALCGISDALQHNDRVINVLQASCLLALYFFGRGRILEGYYHSSIAARLAVSLGLHQIRSDSWFQLQFQLQGFPSLPPSSNSSSVQLQPPKDAIESEERVAAFWQVFMVDRAWSVATGLPAALPDDDHPQAQIETVWPTPLSQFPSVLSDNTMQRYDPVTAYPTLRAKAVALYEKTYRLTSSTSATKVDGYWIEHRALEMSLSQFAANLPLIGMASGQNPLSLADIDLFVIHTMIHVSTLHLHRDLAKTQAVPYEKCWIAANAVTTLVRELSENDYNFLDPIISACWHCTAEVFVKAFVPPTSQANQNANEIAEQQIDVLLSSMRTLARLFPIAGIHATKTEQQRTAARNTLGIS
ncbi:hypothetical protein EIP91_005766 [Steccherinum ochraceum]|uniref:Zn(2)-C6 fungal-type domain-containing protein n=1 Tax=Steccherinum ochraceum TaxID=92696 RepID=A0A4R0R9D3_9APHY|nr:hypothetical protein EIP91_005766 [Steccherinum ochraceum]